MPIKEGQWGLVYVTRGVHKGRIGYYDDDEGAKAIVYFGDMFNKLNQEVFISRKYIEIATFNQIISRHSELASMLFESSKLPLREAVDLFNEAYLVQREFYELHIEHFFDKSGKGKKVFISHTSSDKWFVRRLAIDLRESGFDPWFDEWKIRVGESITQKIESGLFDTEFMIVILSEKSIKSGWVQREWQNKYWDEVKENRTIVLPVLLNECVLPQLLKDKKYANFKSGYEKGFLELLKAMV